MQSIILLVVFFNSMISTFMFKIILNSLPQSSLKYIKHSYSKAHNTFTSWDHHRSILFCLFLWGFWSVLVSLNVKLSICFILRIYIKHCGGIGGSVWYYLPAKIYLTSDQEVWHYQALVKIWSNRKPYICKIISHYLGKFNFDFL